MPEEIRKLAAIMFTDMVGYSALTQKNETLAMELLKLQNEMLRPLFPKFHGIEIKTIGDAFLVEFESTLEAINCGIEMQRILYDYNSTASVGRNIVIRIGIHVGDVIHRENDVFGDGVNIAARVEPLATPGGICITEDVFRQIQNKTESEVVRLGKGKMKNIQLATVIYKLILPWEKKRLIYNERLYFIFRKNKSVWIRIMFVILALLGVLNLFVPMFLRFTNSFGKDVNPTYYRYNNQQLQFEVFNARNENLWSIPMRNPTVIDENGSANTSVIADINADGMNEVITILPFTIDKNKEGSVKVFSFDKRLMWEKEFIEEVHYLNRHNYESGFIAAGILLFDASNKEKQDVFVNTNNMRSPAIIFRLDNDGNVLGEYWHFGSCNVFKSFDLDNDGQKELISAGLNDTEDSTNNEFGCIVVLDPTKIVGKKKSLNAPGFALPFSEAEIYSVKLPNTDMNILMNARSPVTGLRTPLEKKLYFLTVMENFLNNSTANISFEYIFSFDMKILEVKSTQSNFQIRNQFINERKVQGIIDQNYLNDLKKRVQYWDGEKFVYTPTMNKNYVEAIKKSKQ
ncbi:adenylate/guanylate cyclase domain-containing protein [Candidatus Woesearchaeota archaeon]|nr:adenylate/guanylate cyclase domain-containing protein [Candidatus Woesearchaeota archaeon]